MTRPWLDDRTAANGLAVHENFTRFFGASRAVHADNSPQVFFHGTNFSFDAFSRNQLGVCVDNPTTQFGFFFTDSPEEAAGWADRAVRRHRADAAQQVMPVYLAAQHPKQLTHEQFAYYLRKARADTIDRHSNKMRQAGHDGPEITTDIGTRWFCVFNANQVKSALGNCGLWLAASPELTDQRAALALEQAQRAKCSIAEYALAPLPLDRSQRVMA